jgi:hypothetical protein
MFNSEIESVIPEIELLLLRRYESVIRFMRFLLSVDRRFGCPSFFNHLAPFREARRLPQSFIDRYRGHGCRTDSCSSDYVNAAHRHLLRCEFKIFSNQSNLAAEAFKVA